VIIVGCGRLPAPRSGANVLINGAGATFPYPIYVKWFDAFHNLHPDIRINYQSIGSGGGIRQLLAGTVDFGASDSPMADKQLAQSDVAILHFPTVLGAIVPTYNVPGLTATLSVTDQALAGIFLGKVEKWNHPELVRANMGVNLPAEDIVVVHRSDGSGTTFIWTDYLSKVNAEWKQVVGCGTSVKWPKGLGAKGNEGVSGLVKQTPYSIGYVELVYAIQNRMPYARVRNSSGKFVRADLPSVTAAAAVPMPDDFRVSLTNSTAPNAYPISSFTWLLVRSKVEDSRKRQGLIDFLHWMLTSGQDIAPSLGFAPLPPAVVAKETRAISQIK